MAKDTRKQVAYDYLHDAILCNQLKPGSAIVEQEISDLLNISRTPVREALKVLEAEGLVRQIPQRGTFVEQINTQDVEEIFALREALEVLALHEAIKHVSDKELDKLEKYLTTLTSDSKEEEFYSSDRLLHNLIIQNGGNRRLANFLHAVNSQVERLRLISALRPNRLEQSMEEHLAIVKAFKSRDLEAAERELRQHIKNVKESTLEVCRTTFW